MNIVLDTSVLVSALWSPSSKPAAILNAVISRRFTACYDYRILDEYNKVLRRPKFGFSEWEIICLLEPIIKNGISVIAEPLPEIPFTDDCFLLKCIHVHLGCCCPRDMQPAGAWRLRPSSFLRICPALLFSSRLPFPP